MGMVASKLKRDKAMNHVSKIYIKSAEKIKKNGLRLFFKDCVEKIFNFRRTRIIQDLINLNNARTYIEIGVREGDVFKNIDVSRKIAVDVERRAGMKELADNEVFYEMTSDQFFENEAPQLFDTDKIDIAFIDGYHEFFQVLRDFQNTEKFISEKGIIVMHDCNPVAKKTEATRGGLWSGDAWKAAYYINHHRSDLNFFTLNCDYGLGVVYGFDKRMQPSQNAEQTELLRKIKELNYNFLEKNRKASTNLKSPFARRLLFTGIEKHIHSQ
ncbi:MAG TPA: class I SAM-dependent methyltransferase [Balneolaceae bacterium]|nr:class I SAM-dependent methyltransferase [Balneolaceae bacterium]